MQGDINAFSMACKRFIYVENLGVAEDHPEPAPARGTARAEQPDTPKPGTKEAPAKAIPFIVAAMRAIDPDAEWYSLGQVGQFITQGNPDFDTTAAHIAWVRITPFDEPRDQWVDETVPNLAWAGPDEYPASIGPIESITADINLDGRVDGGDLAILLAAYAPRAISFAAGLMPSRSVSVRVRSAQPV